MSNTFTVTLPDTFTVASRKNEYTFKTEGLPAAMVAMGAIHGFTQKLADSLADGKKVAGKERDTVDAVWAAIMAGDWTRRRAAGAGLSEIDAEILRIARGKVVVAFMAKHGVKKIKELTDEQNDLIDDLAEKLAARDADTIRPVAQQAIDARRASKAVEVDVDLDNL